MHKNLQKILEGLGFDDKEARVYLACLELDGAPNTRIAEHTHLNRITNYEILKRLEKDGVVASYTLRGVKHFGAIDPRIVIRRQKEKLAEAEQRVPELLSITNTIENKPRVYFFEGIEGIKSVYEDTLNARTEILTFTNPEDIESLLGKAYMEKYLAERVRRNICVRGLAPDSESGRLAQKVGQTLLRTVRLFPQRTYPLSNEIMLYDDTIAIISGLNKTGLVIKNTELAETFRSIWHMAWQQAGALK